MESLLDGRPGTCLTAPDRHRTVRAMAIVVLNVEIVFRFAKVRQHLVVRPFIIAKSRPGVEILGKSALHGLTVNRHPPPITLPCATWISPFSWVMVPRKAQLCFD